MTGVRVVVFEVFVERRGQVKALKEARDAGGKRSVEDEAKRKRMREEEVVSCRVSSLADGTGQDRVGGQTRKATGRQTDRERVLVLVGTGPDKRPPRRKVRAKRAVSGYRGLFFWLFFFFFTLITMFQ